MPQEKFDRILDVASRYPSAGHTEPQEFIVVRNQRVKENLVRAALNQMFVAQAPLGFHALQSLLYQVAWTVILAVGWAVSAILTVVLVGFLLFPVMAILTVVPFVHMGYAAYKVSQGVDYRYPFVADLIDGSRRNETL